MSNLTSWMIGGFLNFAGPVTLVAVLLWAWSLWKVLGPLPSWREFNWKLWGGALIGTLVVFLSTNVGLKVLSDETNLLSVANMLTIFGKAFAAARNLGHALA